MLMSYRSLIFLVLFTLAGSVGWPDIALAKPLVVQASKFPQHFRLTIKWTQKIPYQVEQNGQKTIIVFDREASLKKLGFDNLPPFIQALATDNVEGSLVTKLTLSETASLKHSWRNGNFIIDILNHPLRKKRASKSTPLDASVTGGFLKKSQRLQKNKTPFVLISSQKNPVGSSQESYSLSFKWLKPVKAAVVHWGETLIIAFSHPGEFDLSSLKDLHVSRLQPLDQGTHSVLALPIKHDHHPLVRRQENTWIIDIQKTLKKPLRKKSMTALRPSFSESSPKKGLLKGENLDTPIVVEDPVTGFSLSLFPGQAPSRGVQNSCQFNSLPTLAGAAILHKSPELAVHKHESGIEIDSSDFLFVSREKDIFGSRQMAQVPPLIHFPKELFKNNSKSNLAETPLERAQKSLALGLPKRAFQHLSPLLLAPTQTPINSNSKKSPLLLINKLEVQAFMVLAALLDGNLKFAALHIHNQALQETPEGQFLKALYEIIREGDFREAHTVLVENSSVFQTYPGLIRNKILFLAAKAAVETHHNPETFLTYLDSDTLSDSEKALKSFYEGKILEFQGKWGKAFARFKSLSHSSYALVKEGAHLSLIGLNLEKNKPLPSSKIDRYIQTLETLKKINSEGRSQHRLSILLAKLYGKQKKYTKALTELRAIYEGSQIPHKKELFFKWMSEMFAKNILESSHMTPLERLIFYEDFKNFMPKNKNQVLIHLKLVETYLSLDLLDRAQKILETLLSQKRHSEIHLSSLFLLGDVYMRNGKYKKVIELLETDTPEKLPVPLQKKRYHLLFKSLLKLKRYEQAQELVDSHQGTQTMNMEKLELAWHRKEWKLVQSILSDLVYHNRDKNEDDPALIMNYALSTFFNEDQEELENLREIFLDSMKKSDQFEAFDIITQQDSNQKPENRIGAEIISNLGSFEEFISHLNIGSEQG